MRIGFDVCRGCLSNKLFDGVDLGSLPIANELYSDFRRNHEVFPLNMKICADCGLGQVENLISPKRLFEDYRYLSSVSSSFLNHAKNYAERLTSELLLDEKSLVIEIASNDGYFLRNFLDKGTRVLGIEPAKNIAVVALNLGINTLCRFFGSETALEILSKHGKADVIVANNVAAHVPDLCDFLSGIAILCKPETIVSIENPSILNILEGAQFDTIYHEHFSYLSANSIRIAAERCNLVLFKVEEISTHGGSLRFLLKLDSASARDLAVENCINQLCDQEKEKGLLDPEAWMYCQQNINSVLGNFRDWIANAKNEGRKILGFGAAAKSSTLINASKILPGSIDGIIDSSLEKQGRMMPSHNIPIISITDAVEMQPTDVVIFPWNLKDEIHHIILDSFVILPRVWVAIPKLMEVQK
jgi:2-polyprenyl-3-methyl-5-hydroxy-6-metoxy-1,4-benzoquinol methylase